jgi:hypothetical protein
MVRCGAGTRGCHVDARREFLFGCAHGRAPALRSAKLKSILAKGSGNAPSADTSIDAAASKTHPQMRGSGRETRGFSYILVGPPPGPMETGTSAHATELA